MGYQVALSPSARRDLRDIVRYISDDSPDRAGGRRTGATENKPKPATEHSVNKPALGHRGHTSNSCRATNTKLMQPFPYTVRTCS